MRTPHPAWIAALLPGLLILPRPGTLPAAPTGEAVAHLWGWWVALREGTPLLLDTDLLNYPDGLQLPLIDPLHLLPWAAGAWAGPTVGYTVVLWWGLALAGIAGWLLAREGGADRPGQLLGVVAAMSCPTLLTVAGDGITEGLGVGWVGVQLAVLLALARRPTAWRALALGLSIGAAVYAGPYNAVWIALLDLPLGLWLLRRTRWHLASAALAGLLAAPSLWTALSKAAASPGGAARKLNSLPPTVEAWRGAWREGADLLDLLVPALCTGTPAALPTTAYLGIVLVALAGWGLWRDRRAWPWALGAVAFAALSLGPWLVVGGTPARLGGHYLAAPAALLEALPALDRMSRWYRAGAVAVLLLIPLAARAVRGRAALLATLLVLADARLLSPLPAIWPHTPAPTRTALSTLDGPLAQLPALFPLGQPGTLADEGLFLQVLHGLPTNGGFESWPGQWTVHPALRQADRVARGRSDTLDLGPLRRAGYRYLVVYKRRVQPGALRILLGPPVAEDERVVAWPIP